MEGNYLSWPFLRNLGEPADDFFGLLAHGCFIQNEDSSLFNHLDQFFFVSLYDHPLDVILVGELEAAN